MKLVKRMDVGHSSRVFGIKALSRGWVLGVVSFSSAFIQEANGAAFLTTGDMISSHCYHTATLLPNGKVLIAGGICGGGATAELYDPATGAWILTGQMTTQRVDHTATLLPSGMVLVAGGHSSGGGGSFLSSAELYDPAAGAWILTGPMGSNRVQHTATLLPNGKVLVAGGFNVGIAAHYLSAAELYDPATGTWVPTGSMTTNRYDHTATTLPNGKVLAAGGRGIGPVLSKGELYDPATGMWTKTDLSSNTRYYHTATLLPTGKVLVTGGNNGSTALASAEIFDPGSGTWTNTTAMNTAREHHSATLLPNGKVLITGGDNSTNSALSTAELYDPATETWTVTSTMNNPRVSHTATMLAGGRALLAGGTGNSAELYDFAFGTWTNTGTMNTARQVHTATLLPDGTVLVAGGSNATNDGTYLKKAELYDAAAGAWSNVAPMNSARGAHTAIVLPNGQVLVAGGTTNLNLQTLVAYCTASAELYDVTNRAWALTGTMSDPRRWHTATLLSSGKVLVSGGATNSKFATSRTELYDPAKGAWRPTSPLNTARHAHTATLLPNGKVLVAGGFNNTNVFATAELYDPVSGIWTPVGTMGFARYFHTATLLPSGKVLVAGGTGTTGAYYDAEIYDPLTGNWAVTGSLNTGRAYHTATLLPNGKVLVTGGEPESGGWTASTEVFDPSSGNWTANGLLNYARLQHTATLLASGKVLIAAGDNSSYPWFTNTPTAELYDPGLGPSTWQPQIASATSPLNLGAGLNVTGLGFRGVSEGSGGNTQDSAADYPLVQLRSLGSGQSVFLLCTNWSTNSFNSAPVSGFPPGWALATVFVNGIPSTGSFVNVSVPVPTPMVLTGAKRLTNDAFQFSFTNSPGAAFGVLASTNVALPLSNWTALGGVVEVSPGQFQFIDAQVTNGARRFYCVRVP